VLPPNPPAHLLPAFRSISIVHLKYSAPLRERREEGGGAVRKYVGGANVG